MPKYYKSFFNSITVRYIGITTAILVALQMAILGLHTRREAIKDLNHLEARIEGKVQLLEAVSPESILKYDFLSLERLMKQVTGDEAVIYSMLVSPTGAPLTQYLDENNPDVITAWETLKKNTSSQPKTDLVSITKEIQKASHVRHLQIPVRAGDNLLGEIWLGYSTQKVWQEIFHSLIAGAIVSCLIIAIVTALAIKIFRREIFKPSMN